MKTKVLSGLGLQTDRLFPLKLAFHKRDLLTNVNVKHSSLNKHTEEPQSFLAPQLIPTALRSTAIVTKLKALYPLSKNLVPTAAEHPIYLKITSASLLLNVSVQMKQPDSRLNFHGKSENSYLLKKF